MRKISKSPLLIFVYGTVAAAFMIGLTLLFLNPPQCPDGYSRQQVDAADCIIGANIGFGLTVMLTIGVWIAVTIVALIVYAHMTLGRKDASKWLLAAQIILVVLATACTVYLVTWFLLESLGTFVDDGYQGPEAT